MTCKLETGPERFATYRPALTSDIGAEQHMKMRKPNKNRLPCRWWRAGTAETARCTDGPHCRTHSDGRRRTTRRSSWPVLLVAVFPRFATPLPKVHFIIPPCRVSLSQLLFFLRNAFFFDRLQHFCPPDQNQPPDWPKHSFSLDFPPPESTNFEQHYQT